MWFMMIISIIFTAILISRLVDPFTAQALMRSFWVVGLAALVLGITGVIGTQDRNGDSRDGDTLLWRNIEGCPGESSSDLILCVPDRFVNCLTWTGYFVGTLWRAGFPDAGAGHNAHYCHLGFFSLIALLVAGSLSVVSASAL
jgi:hypothetical protein